MSDLRNPSNSAHESGYQGSASEALRDLRAKPTRLTIDGHPDQTRIVLLPADAHALVTAVEVLLAAAKRVVQERGPDHEPCGCERPETGIDCDIACLREALWDA